MESEMQGASEDDLPAKAAAVSGGNGLGYEEEARLVAEARASWERKAKGEESDDEEDPEMLSVYHAYETRQFRNTWNCLYFGYFGRFEDSTRIHPARFTDEPPGERRRSAYPSETLQVFSVRVTAVTGGLQWPLHVFGKVALRDSDDCQILTREAPDLRLTGSSPAVLLLDPVTFKVDLKVRGRTEPEDEHLSFLAAPFLSMQPADSCLRRRAYTSKLSTLKFTLGIIISSVEATISARVSGGSWPDGLHAQVILLDSGDGELPPDGDGAIALDRRVASVEGGEVVAHGEMGFKARKAGRSSDTLDVGFCQVVSVAWSLF
ncbi:hypothetical protein PAHAL_1G285400 [Panicum hallii]|uniref:DUF6598 domain-containing protein n=1 Tax=Panicum hallii TaxID=206008 RepID=A0A2T8KWN4_9POAL|nr:hypothetical protein PAHAL_1G285400 [Panicum hallii]